MASSGIRVRFILRNSTQVVTATYENATPQMVAAELFNARQIKTDQGMIQTSEIVNFEILTA